MPYKDLKERRDYDKAYKQKRRSAGWTIKGLDKRLTEADVATAEDLRYLLNEVIEEARHAEGAALNLETKLRIKLRAIEIGLRMIEVTDFEQRITALEEGKVDVQAPSSN